MSSKTVRKSPLFLLVGGLSEVVLAPLSWVSPAHSALVVVFSVVLLLLHAETDNKMSLVYLPQRALGRTDMAISLVYTLLLLVIVGTINKRPTTANVTVTPWVSAEGVLVVTVFTLAVASSSSIVCSSYGGNDRWWSAPVDATCWVPGPNLGMVLSYCILVVVGGLQGRVSR